MRRTPVRLLLRTGVVLTMLGTVVGIGTAHAVTTSGRTCTIVGTAGNDRLVGTASNDVICGLGGNDDLRGGGGNDLLAGGPGYDYLRGGPGSDVFSGGPDPDTVWYDDHNTPVRAYLDAYANDGSAGERDRIADDVENLVGGNNNDILVGNSRKNLIYGLGRDDLIDGGLGDDILSGGSGVDELTYATRTKPLNVSLDNRQYDGEPGERDQAYDDLEIVTGGSGDDILVGSDYSDLLSGGPGNDSLRGRGGADYLYGDAGTDIANYSERTASVNLTLDGQANDGVHGEADRISGDVEVLRGGSGNDVLAGGSGDDRLEGLAGNDRLYGFGGDDTLLGGDGQNFLAGGEGADTLSAEYSFDRLYGEGGNDRLGGAHGGDAQDGGSGLDICTPTAAGQNVACEVTTYWGPGTHVLHGRVVDSTGAPIPDVALALRNTTARTGADGVFFLAGEASEQADLTLLYPDGLGDDRRVILSAPVLVPTDQEVTLVLPTAPSRVTFHVQDQTGAARAGADIYLAKAVGDEPFAVGLLAMTLSLTAGLPVFTLRESEYGGRSDDAGDFHFLTYATSLPRVLLRGTAGGPQMTREDVAVPEDGRVVLVLDPGA